MRERELGVLCARALDRGGCAAGGWRILIASAALGSVCG